jgi:probable F420-dependent oxidoreductase
MKLGTNLPEHLIGTDHGALAAFLEALEGLGFGYITVGDHVLGADLAARPDWRPYFGQAPLYDHHMPWHEPMVLFGFLAAMTTSLELSTGILIAPQRQAALLAKQAAEVDVLSGGRVRLVIATGWNDVEYEALAVPFRDRGRILEEQVALMRQLWTEEVVTYRGRYHTVTAAGINPLPVQRPIPLWFGGQSEVVLRRTGRLADGWFPYYPSFSEERLRADLEVIHQAARDAGRDPAAIGLEGAVYFYDGRFPMPPGGRLPPQTLEECVEYAQTWKTLGADRYWVTAPWADLGPEETGVREPGREWLGVDARIDALRQFRDAVGASF